ncbi:HU family DNA-binding protein [Thiobacillus sp.]
MHRCWQGNPVQLTLVGLGTFKSSKRAARNGRNPKTGAASKLQLRPYRFTAGSSFKAAVARKKASEKK